MKIITRIACHIHPFHLKILVFCYCFYVPFAQATAVNPIQVVLENGSITAPHNTTILAAYRVSIDARVAPYAPLTMRAKTSQPWASVNTTATATCASTTNTCPTPIHLYPGQSCCLMLNINTTNLANRSYDLSVSVTTTPAAFTGMSSNELVTVQTQYAYVPNYYGNMYQCGIDITNGLLSSCAITPASGDLSWRPFFVSVNTTAGTQYAYVSDQFSDTETQLYQCSLNPVTGGFEHCSIMSIPPEIQEPGQVVFETVTNMPYAFIVEYGLHDVYKCLINSDGAFSSCTIAYHGSLLHDAFAALAFATINGTQYAYLTNGLDDVIYQCDVASDGTFSSCNITPTDTVFWDPQYITFATVSNVLYAYVASLDEGVYRCPVNNDGSLTASSCLQTGLTGSWSPASVTFATVSGTQYAYITQSSTPVYQCTLNSNGTFNVCQTTPATDVPVWTPFNLAFAFT